MKITNKKDVEKYYSPLIYGRDFGSDYTRNPEDMKLGKILATISVYGDNGFKYTITVDVTDGEFPYKWRFISDAKCTVEVDFDDNYNSDILYRLKKWYHFATALRSLKIYEPFDDGTSSSDGFKELKTVNNYTACYDVGKRSDKRGGSCGSEMIARENGKVIRGRDGIALLLPVIKQKDDTNLTVSKTRAVWVPMEEVTALLSGEIKAIKRRSRIFKDGGRLGFSLPFEWNPDKEDLKAIKKALNIVAYWGSSYRYDPYIGASGYFGCVFDGGHHTCGRRVLDYINPQESGNSFDDIVKAYEDIYND